jgi:hypothetical protein
MRDLEQLLAARERHERARRHVEGGDDVDQLRAQAVVLEPAQPVLDGVHHHPVAIDGDGGDLRSGRTHVAHHVGEGRGLDDRSVARAQEAPRRQGEPVRGAVAQHDPVGVDGPAVASREAFGNAFAQPRVAPDHVLSPGRVVLRELRPGPVEGVDQVRLELLEREGLWRGIAGVEVVDEGLGRRLEVRRRRRLHAVGDEVADGCLGSAHGRDSF